MKKLALLLPLLVLLACAPSLTPGGDPGTVAGVYVKNSAWAPVPTSEIVKTVAKAARDVTVAVTIADVQAAADEHNASTPDDHWFVLTEDTPVELAPTITAIIVNPATWDEIERFESIPRGEYANYRPDWNAESYAAGAALGLKDGTGNTLPCALYIDNVPPKPEVIVIPGPFLYCALYNTRTMLYYWSEHYELISSTRGRYVSLQYQAEANNLDPTYMGEGPWLAYWGDKPFPEAFPDYSPGTLP